MDGKALDELRTTNNPKVTYGGVMLGGKREVQNRGIMGKMEKHQPDTYYINTPERYFTTTGIEKAQTARSNMIMPTENRETTTQSYYGHGAQADTETTYVPGKYKPANRAVLDAPIKHITNALLLINMILIQENTELMVMLIVYYPIIVL